MFGEIIVGGRDVRMRVGELASRHGITVMHLSGHIMHSSCTIRSIHIVETPDALRILILIGMARPSEKGAFEIDIPVHDDTRAIYLRKDESPVWNRALPAGMASR